MKLPATLRNSIRLIFAQPNDAIATVLSTQAGYHEPELDGKLVEALGRFEAPLATADWYVRVDCVRIGGYPLHGKREAGDIALVAHFYVGGVVAVKKLVVLQSKRLAPSTSERSDAGIVLDFNTSSLYPAINGTQQADIAAFMRKCDVPVAYLFYNPWRLPLSVKPAGINEAEEFFDHVHQAPTMYRRRPRFDHEESPKDVQFGAAYAGKKSVGCRVLPASSVHEKFDMIGSLSYGKLTDIEGFGSGKKKAGWKLENFVADVFLQCEFGRKLDDTHAELAQFSADLSRLAHRVLSAAIIVSVDAPKGFRFE